MKAERLHHTQQFSHGHKIEGFDEERPLHHTTTGKVLGNVALGEYDLTQQRRPFRTISREEVLVQEAREAKLAALEADRTHFVDAAFKDQSKLATTINAAPEEPEIDLAVYVETNTGHPAQTDY